MRPAFPRPGRWLPVRGEPSGDRRPYRDPAPDPAAWAPLTVEESGCYQALREHWLLTWLRRLVGASRQSSSSR